MCFAQGPMYQFPGKVSSKENCDLFMLLYAFSCQERKTMQIEASLFAVIYSYQVLFIRSLLFSVCIILKIFNLLCAFMSKPHWIPLEMGMVQFLGSRSKLLFNFFLLYNNYTILLECQKTTHSLPGARGHISRSPLIAISPSTVPGCLIVLWKDNN